jgi:hypothetical protein
MRFGSGPGFDMCGLRRTGPNLVTSASDLTAAAWTKSAGVTASANTSDVVDPIGGHGASKAVYDGSLANGSPLFFQQIGVGGLPVGVTYRYSMWLRTSSGTKTLQLTANITTQPTFVVTTTWKKFEIVETISNSNQPFLAIYLDAADHAAVTLYEFDARLAKA